MRPVGILVVLVLVVLQTVRLSVGAPIDATIDTTVVPTTIDTKIVPTTIDTTGVPTTIDTKIVPTTIDTTGVPTNIDTKIVPTTIDTTGVPTNIDTKIVPTTIDTKIVPTTRDTTIAPTTIDATGVPTAIDTKIVSTTIDTKIVPTTRDTTIAPTTIDTTVVPTAIDTKIVSTTIDTKIVPTTIDTTVVPTTIDTTVVPTSIDTTVVPTTIDTTVVPTSIDTTIVQTTTFCAPPTCDAHCFLDTYSGGCPTQCICGDPICMLVSCGGDADCVESNENSEGYICVPRYGTTIEPTSDPTIETSAPPCEDISSWCTGSCFPDYSYSYSGCPSCICADYWGSACEYASCGPDEDCVPNDDYSSDYTCVPRYETATELPTCPTIDCDPNCNVEYGSDGCPAYCSCGDPICMLVSCGPDAECVENEYNPYDYSCVSTTTTSDSEAADPCPPQDPCNKRCMYGLQTDKSGCQLCECLPEPTP